jgi:hypothetical protein
MYRLMRIWRILNLPCDEIAILISASFDHEQSRLERIAWRSHLLYCSACRRFRRHVLFLRKALTALRDGLDAGRDDLLPGPELPGPVRERIRASLRR